MTASSFPPETIDRIIDFLWDDTATLCACALTCRRWLPTSRFQLFRGTIKLRGRTSMEAFVRASRMDHLRPYLEYAKSLILTERRERPYVHSFPLVIAPGLSKLQGLEINGIDWGAFAIHPSAFDVGFSSLKGVTTLTLRSCTFRTLAEFRSLLCALPRLAHLVLGSVHTKKAAQVLPQGLSATRTRHARPALLSLAINRDDPFVDDVGAWLSCTSTADSMQSLLLTYFDIPALAQIEGFVRGLASLGSLKLAFFFSTGVVDYLERNLAPLASLRDLSINLFAPFPTPALPPEIVTELLAAIPRSCPIRSLALTLNNAVRPERIGWEHIARLLAHEPFRALESLEVQLDGGESDAWRGLDLREAAVRGRAAREIARVRRTGVRAALVLNTSFPADAEGSLWEACHFRVDIDQAGRISTRYDSAVERITSVPQGPPAAPITKDEGKASS